EAQDVSAHQAARVQHHVTVHGYQVTHQLPVDVGGPVHHQEVSRHALVGADAEVTQPGRSVRDGEVHRSILWAERAAEPRLECGRLAQVTEVDGVITRLGWRDGLRTGTRTRFLLRGPPEAGHVRHQGPETMDQPHGAA